MHTKTINSYSHLTRQLTLIPVERIARQPITVIGCGAIGSFAALALAKMGVEDITLWDFDEVGVENVSCQLYGTRHMGQEKVTALADMLLEMSETKARSIPGRFLPEYASNPEYAPRGIVLLAVDSMKARKEIAEVINQHCILVTHVIDPRMGAEKLTMHCERPFTGNYSKYLQHYMYADQDVVEPACTAKATVYTAMLAGGLIAKTVKNIVMGQPYPRLVTWDIASTAETSMQMFAAKEE